MVYVVSKNNKPLMPTKNYAKVRILLKKGRAKVLFKKPFTIKLLYNTPEYTQKTVTSLDKGRYKSSLNVVGKEKGDLLFVSELELRNAEIPELMQERKMYRHGRRRNKRQKKIRRAKQNGTYFKRAKSVKEKGTDEPVTVKYIKKKPARSHNRKRHENWLTPTANQLLKAHLNYIEKISRILPIDEIVIEYARFDTHRLRASSVIEGEDYQKGDMYGYENMRAFKMEKQEGKCLLCSNKLKELHHIKENSKRGSEHHSNIAGLCRKCHEKVHKDPELDKKLLNLNEGLEKDLDSTAVLNTIAPYLYKGLQERYGKNKVFVTYGYITKTDRERLNLPKEHYIDSYLIALQRVNNPVVSYKIINNEVYPYQFKQFRRHNRRVEDAFRDRLYKEGNKIAARNRNKKTGQKEDSLKEYRERLREIYPDKEVDRKISNFKKVRAKKRKRASPHKLTVTRGCVVEYKGERYVVKGLLNKGATLRLYGKSKENISLNSVRLLQRNAGIVCL